MGRGAMSGTAEWPAREVTGRSTDFWRVPRKIASPTIYTGRRAYISLWGPKPDAHGLGVPRAVWGAASSALSSTEVTNTKANTRQNYDWVIYAKCLLYTNTKTKRVVDCNNIHADIYHTIHLQYRTTVARGYHYYTRSIFMKNQMIPIHAGESLRVDIFTI